MTPKNISYSKLLLTYLLSLRCHVNEDGDSGVESEDSKKSIDSDSCNKVEDAKSNVSDGGDESDNTVDSRQTTVTIKDKSKATSKMNYADLAVSKKVNDLIVKNSGSAFHLTIVGPFPVKIGHVWVVSFDKHLWYHLSPFAKVWFIQGWKHSHKGEPNPNWLTSLDDWKLRVKHSITNEMVKNNGSDYADTRWGMVFRTQSDDKKKLERQLNQMIELMKDIYSARNDMPVGRMFLKWCNTGDKSYLIKGMKKYMGDSDNIVENRVNSDLVAFGNKSYVFDYDNTLDAFWTDSSIKEFITEYYDKVSWDGLEESVLQMCYKGYPERTPPIWDGTSD